MADIPEHEQPLEERCAEAGRQYEAAAAQARYYRENKKNRFSRMVNEVFALEGEMPMNKAQSLVHASEAWQDFTDKLLETANKAAELKMAYENLKIELDRQRRQEIQSAVERKYSRYS